MTKRKVSAEAKEAFKRRKAATVELHELGFEGYLIPRKHKKMSYKGVLITDKKTWDKPGVWKSEALSVFMGTEFVAIDIDHPSMLCPELKELLKAHPTFSIWHGPVKPLEGGKGSFIFKTSPTHSTYKRYKRNIIRSDNRILSHGYEILRGNTSSMCYGIHHDREWYEHNSTTPAQLPEELYEYLKRNGELKKAKKKSEHTAKLSDNPEKIEKFMEEVEDVFNNRGIFLTRLEVGELLATDDCLLKLVGADDANHTFVLYVNKDGSYVVTTNQSNFRRDLPPQRAFSDIKLPVKLKKRKRSKIHRKSTQARDAELRPADTTDLKSMMTWGRVVGISASTGSGKSFTSREAIMEWLEDSPENKAVYMTSDNKNARAMALMFDDLSEIFNLNAKTSSAWKDHKENIRCVITNQHYLARKGITDRNHYAILSWVDSKTLVIIDEADMLYNKMKFEQPLKFRYSLRSKEGGDEFDYVRPYNVCKSNSADGYHCNDCVLSHKMAVRTNQVLKNKEYTGQKVTVGALESDKGWADLYSLFQKEGTLGEIVDLHNSDMLNLKAHKVEMLDQSYLNRRKVSFNDDVTPFDSLEDLLKCSHDAFIMINEFDEELIRSVREEFLEEHKDKTNPSRYANRDLMKYMRDHNIRYPYALCNTPVLKLFDMSGLRRLVNEAARVVLLSATYSQQQMDYFEAAMPGITWLNYTGKTFKAIDNLLVITTDEQFNNSSFKFLDRLHGGPEKVSILEEVTKNSMDYLEKIGEEDGHDVYAGRTLLVQPFSNFGTEKDSAGIFSRVENRIDRFSTGTFNSSNTNSKVVPNTVTYSRSALARGMNLGDYDRCITEGEAYQPADSYHWQSDASNNLETLQTNEKVRLLMQSVGRIMRAPTLYHDGHNKQVPKLRRKVITIYNVGAAFGEAVANVLSPLCTKGAKALHIGTTYSEDNPLPALTPYEAVQRTLQAEDAWLKSGKLKKSFKPLYNFNDPKLNKAWSSTPNEIRKRVGSMENLNTMKELLK